MNRSERRFGMMGLTRRLKRLEQYRGMAAGQGRCPDCGHPINGQRLPEENIKFTVSMAGWDDDDGQPHDCPACGARLVFNLEFDHPDNDL
jgi:hypothetical protein